MQHWNDHKKALGKPSDYCAVKPDNNIEALIRCYKDPGHTDKHWHKGISWFPQPTNWVTVALPLCVAMDTAQTEMTVAFSRV